MIPVPTSRRLFARRSSTFTLIALLALAVLPLAVTVNGCDRVPLFAPSGSTITLAAGTQTMALNQVTDIRAFVLASGGAPVHNGTVVYFSSSLGTLLPNQAETQDGVASVQFSTAGTTTGQAQLSAVSGAAKLSATLTITITTGGSTIARLTLTPSPSTLPVSGGTVQLTALAQDAAGNPIQGFPVSFSATAGTLSNSLAFTDQNGLATVTLTTTVQTTVTATAGGTTATVVISVG